MLKSKFLLIYFIICIISYARYMYREATFLFKIIVPATFNLDRYEETINLRSGESYITPAGEGINFEIYGGFNGNVEDAINNPFLNKRKVKFSILGGDGKGGFEIDGVSQSSSLPDLQVGMRGRGSYGDPIVGDINIPLGTEGYVSDVFEIAFIVNQHKTMKLGSYSTNIRIQVQYY